MPSQEEGLRLGQAGCAMHCRIFFCTLYPAYTEAASCTRSLPSALGGCADLGRFAAQLELS